MTESTSAESPKKATEESPLRPIDCPSAQDWERATRPRPVLSPPGPELPQRFRFRVLDLLAITAAMGVGFAGGHWMPMEYYLLLLGWVVTICVFVLPFYERIDRDLLQRGVTLLLFAYGASCLALLLARFGWVPGLGQ